MNYRGARLRIIFPVGAVLVITAVLFTLLGQREMSNAVGNIARARARAASDLALDTIEARMRSRHGGDLGRSFARLARSPDISAIRVLDSHGKVRASSRVDDLASLPEHVVQRSSDGDALSDPLRGSIIHRVTPIYLRRACRDCHTQSSDVVGLLDVDITTARQASALGVWTTFSGAAGALQIVASLLAIGIAVSVFILRPLRDLTGLMDRVRQGDLSVRMRPVGTREIDAVGDGFNAMVSRLREGATAAEEARRLELERAEHFSAVGRLASGLAHEIRNPLSGVKAALEVLRGDMPKGESSEILSESLAELSRIESVVKDLLSYAKPSPPLLQQVDLNALVNESAVLLLPLAEAKGVQFVRKLADNLPPVIADRDMLHRVIVNLAVNAIDAVHPPGLVTLTTTRSGDEVLCRVRDTGQGVNAASAARLFEPFFTTKSRGTGLGLPISRRLIESFDGRLWLENPGESGASFVFMLPVPTAAAV